MKRIRSLILFFLLVSFQEAIAQQSPFRFQHLTIEDGLSQDIVTAIVQDELGFMWFGTEDGLNVYDGYSFTVFKHVAGDSSSLSTNSIASLLADHDGHIWVATSSGTDIIDTRTRVIRHIYGPTGALPVKVNGFCPAGGGDVWIATMHGLFRTSGSRHQITTGSGTRRESLFRSSSRRSSGQPGGSAAQSRHHSSSPP